MRRHVADSIFVMEAEAELVWKQLCQRLLLVLSVEYPGSLVAVPVIALRPLICWVEFTLPRPALHSSASRQLCEVLLRGFALSTRCSIVLGAIMGTNVTPL